MLPVPTAPRPSRRILMRPSEPVELTLHADYFEGQIDTRDLRSRHPDGEVLSTNPLVLEPRTGSWIYVERFGAVVFWNCPDEVVRCFLEEVATLPATGPRIGPTHDSLAVHVGSQEETVGFSAVWLKELSLDRLKVVSLALAQSVALDYFEISVSAAMARFHPVVQTMRAEGRLRLGHSEVLSLVGFAMEIRSVVLENLTLFDDRPESWESEALAHLDSALFEQFDLEERINAINQKLLYLKDAGATLLDVLTNRKSLRLEWIIVGLIFVEVLFFVWKEILPAIT